MFSLISGTLIIAFIIRVMRTQLNIVLVALLRQYTAAIPAAVISSHFHQ